MSGDEFHFDDYKTNYVDSMMSYDCRHEKATDRRRFLLEPKLQFLGFLT